MIEKLPLLFPGMNLRPALACEISPYGVLAARQDATEGLLTQFAALPDNALRPALNDTNILERAMIVEAVRTAVTAVAERARGMGKHSGRTPSGRRALTLIVPDAAVRVLLLDFDTLPSRRQEALAILRFRLRRLVPFETEDAAVSWQPMGTAAEGVRVLVIAMPRAVLLEYESVVREAGFVPGVVLPSTLAAMPLVGTDAAIVINRNGTTMTTAILRGQELLLHRALHLGGEDAAPASDAPPAQDAPRRLPRTPEARALDEEEDMRQSVSVALAYFEDTLAAPPTELFYIGPGTAQAFADMLGEPSVSVRDLGAPPALPSRTVPRSLLPPVTGALLNA
jgi:type IV pilus assembly protein PilM